MELVKKDTTSKIVSVFLRDSTTGQGKTGVTAIAMSGGYTDNDNATATALSFASGSVGDAYSSGKWAEVGNGEYYYHAPNGMFDQFGFVRATFRSSGQIDGKLDFQVVAFDPNDVDSLGISRIDENISDEKTLVDGAITADKIAAAALTTTKFASGAFDAVWTVATRTLSAFGFGVTVTTNNDKTGYSISGTKTTLDDLNDITAGAAMALTSGERTTLAAAIEAAIINELDGTAVMQAIADLIADDMTTGDLSAQAIASACRDAILDRVLSGNHDTEDTPGLLLQQSAKTSDVTALQTALETNIGVLISAAHGDTQSNVIGNDNANAGLLNTAIAGLNTLVTAIKAVTDKADDTYEDDGGIYRFTANALEQAPSGGGGGGLVTGFDLAAIQQLFTVDANATAVAGSVIRASQGAAGGDVSVDSFTANALQQLSAITITLVSPFNTRTGELELVQRCDYTATSLIGPIKLKLENTNAVSGDAVRFAATLQGHRIQASGAVAEESGVLYAVIELPKTKTNVPASRDWLWELEHVNGSGEASPLLYDKEMTVIPSHAESS